MVSSVMGLKMAQVLGSRFYICAVDWYSAILELKQGLDDWTQHHVWVMMVYVWFILPRKKE